MDVDFSRLKATVNKKKAVENLGTLGYGNHFFEIDVEDNGNYIIVPIVEGEIIMNQRQRKQL